MEALSHHTPTIDAFCDAVFDIAKQATAEQRNQLHFATSALIETLAHAAASQSAGVAVAFVERLQVLEQHETELTQRLEAVEREVWR